MLLIGGHRGSGCTDHPFYAERTHKPMYSENSLESILNAFKLGAHFVEIDAILSADNEVLILHNSVPKDHYFGANIPPKLLNKLPFVDIKTIPVGKINPAPILTLRELLTHMPDPTKNQPFTLNIELKGVIGTQQNSDTEQLTAAVAKTIKAANFSAQNILFSSFVLENVIAMAKLLPKASFGQLFKGNDAPSPPFADKQDFNNTYLHFTKENANKVIHTFSQHLQNKAALTYLIPEITTLTNQDIHFYAAQQKSIISWALVEKLDAQKIETYKNLAMQAKAANINFGIITDYLPPITNINKH